MRVRCTYVLFAGSEHTHSMCNDAQSRLADIIYGSQTEQAGCDKWLSGIRMEQSVDVFVGRLTLFPFVYPIILNDRLSIRAGR